MRLRRHTIGTRNQVRDEPPNAIFCFCSRNTNVKKYAYGLTIIHGIADLISMLLRRPDEIQQTDWDSGMSATGVETMLKTCY
jgi:hypothetical protein